MGKCRALPRVKTRAAGALDEFDLATLHGDNVKAAKFLITRLQFNDCRDAPSCESIHDVLLRQPIAYGRTIAMLGLWRNTDVSSRRQQ
jgi:hypothetical protein